MIAVFSLWLYLTSEKEDAGIKKSENTPSMESIDLVHSSEEDVEDRITQLLTLQNPVLLRHILKEEFNYITTFLEDQKHIKDYEELVENLDQTFIGFLMRLFAVWVTAIEYNNMDLAHQVAERLHKLYVRTSSIDYTVEPKRINSLWLQSQIVFLAYCLGAFAVTGDKLEFAKLLVNKGNPFDEGWRNRTWFRYVLTMIGRTRRHEKKSLCTLAFDLSKSSPYITKQFEGEDELRSALCQFDFFQCASSLAKGEVRDCYPSFAGCHKFRIEPIVEKIIETCETGKWIPKIEKSTCAKIIDCLDKFADKEFGLYSDWDYGEWRNTQIMEFIKTYKE
jgi:hypothetical protein